MEKLLKLKIYVDGGVNDTPFPNMDAPIEIGAFRYDAKRMGGAPTITASVDYPSCLDGVWTDAVYASFNGEKYYLKQTPTSSYNNESTMYRHDLELVSERVILDNVYFFDTVVGNPQGEDKPVSDSTKVVFFGNIREFVARLNSSLQYSGLDYTVVVDSGITTEEKLMSFEDQFFSNVLQEIYNTYEVPYYFEGKTIHIGWAKEDDGLPTFAYGVDDALVSIAKNNANYKIVNRATGTGSSDNIPFYYPNNSPKGEIEAEASQSSLGVKIVDGEAYGNNVDIDGQITYQAFTPLGLSMEAEGSTYTSGTTLHLDKIIGSANRPFDLLFSAQYAGEFEINLNYTISNVRNKIKGSALASDTISCRFSVDLYKDGEFVLMAKSIESGRARIVVEEAGEYVALITMEFASKRGDVALSCDYSLEYRIIAETPRWIYNGRGVKLSELGLACSGTPEMGDTITQRLVKYVKTSQNLMPSIYRETDGAERFYNATNGTYEGVEFNNPYIAGRPKEHIITVEDIKPTIEGTEVNGLRIDMFSEFAYDEDDNDETYEDEEGNVYFKHPYFYGKLRVMDFNLFDHAIEQQPMTISFTSGDSGACNFEIGVTEEYPQKNPVQVDDNGNLVRDKNGMIVAGVEGTQQMVTEFQDRQQDTSKYEVWIALRKEEDTYGILMPQVAHRPKACTEGKNDGDTFVILGINLPKSYILNAEKRLEAEIIKYMKDNNDEKFTFSIGFSRIYFEENPEILQYLSENSKVTITYDGKEYDLYVSSFSYNMSEGDVLPEIRVELDETLKVSQNALQNAISQVKAELGAAIRQVSAGVAMQKSAYIQKQADDEAHGMVNFTKGIKFGEGGKVEVMDNNSAKLTIEYLEVTKKASFTSLEIQEKTHVGGQILVTPAAVNCGEVEELEDAYRCYFQTKGADGDEIFNQFAVGDQAICQTFNAWGSKYYWRLVTGIGEDYIDLSKTDCDEDSGIPSAGDKIIQMGNREDEERQNAIVIAAYGDGSPYIIQYKGINAFEIPDDKIVTKLSSTENIFTGKVHIELGSDGVENLGLEVGGQNMLRNSGFTGDYLSAQIADQTILDQVDETFNPPLVHWETTNASAQDSTESQSGKEVLLSQGSMTQTLYQRVVANESYMLSFKAKGISLTYSVGGVTNTVELTDDWMGYVEKIETTENGDTFSIINGNCLICDLQLERGTIATAWSNSYLDNASDRLYYQAQQYVSAALKNATEASTDIYGGLVLTRHIKVGDGSNNAPFRETGGMSGYFTDGNSPYAWAGGDFDKAVATAIKYPTNTTTPDGEVPYVVTHGGRIIANDAVIRGKIYATEGEFKGNITAMGGSIGLLKITVDPYTGETTISSYGDCHIGKDDTVIIANEGYYAHSTYNTQEGVCSLGYESKLTGIGFKSIRTSKNEELEQESEDTTDIIIEHNLDEFDGKEVSIKVNSGKFAGLRPTTRVITNNLDFLDEFDFSVLIPSTEGTYDVRLPNNPLDGQEYWVETFGANIEVSSQKQMWSHVNGEYEYSHTFSARGVIRFKYYSEVNTWTYSWVESH